jgi:hypothetical protein
LHVEAGVQGVAGRGELKRLVDGILCGIETLQAEFQLGAIDEELGGYVADAAEDGTGVLKTVEGAIEASLADEHSGIIRVIDSDLRIGLAVEMASCKIISGIGIHVIVEVSKAPAKARKDLKMREVRREPGLHSVVTFEQQSSGVLSPRKRIGQLGVDEAEGGFIADGVGGGENPLQISGCGSRILGGQRAPQTSEAVGYCGVTITIVRAGVGFRVADSGYERNARGDLSRQQSGEEKKQRKVPDKKPESCARNTK